ncbi:DNA-binding XRE family transcriptional regulator [Paraburkholderia sp. BL21I4N1]|nr:helix-turn-helix transcriptional regulator [Paraburkholderia sp. BL21I4N1]PQV51900.1 DNA-binding XRE family transcriptional regulator [Paraburkholderia sp. BL21I4N1]
MLGLMKSTPKQPAGRNPITAAVGRRLKEVRRNAGKSQEDLAHEASVGRAAISSIESGVTNPTVLTLAALCAALGLSLSDLFAPLTMTLESAETRRANVANPPKIERSRLR